MNDQQQPDPRLAWITQALQDASQTLPPAARAAYVARASADLQLIAAGLQSAAQAPAQSSGQVLMRDRALSAAEQD